MPTLQSDVISTLERCLSSGPGGEPDVRSWLQVAGEPVSLTRDGHPSHFTASALPMTADGELVCLVLHRRMGRWVQPGGHLESRDRSVGAAALREMHEETGLESSADPVLLQLSRHPAPCRREAWHLDFQFLVVSGHDEPVTSDESHGVEWFEVGKLPEGMASGVEDLVLAGHRRLSRTGSPGRRSPGA